MTRQIQGLIPEVVTYGLASRVNASEVDRIYDTFSETIQDLFKSNYAIVGVCAAGILIRSLAPLLNQKWQEPAVLAIAEDGSAVVPLLGGINGANQLARDIASIFDSVAAITTSGDVRFGTTLLSPPSGYTLVNPDDAKLFLSNVLAGKTVKLDGSAPWLEASAALSQIARHR